MSIVCLCNNFRFPSDIYYDNVLDSCQWIYPYINCVYLIGFHQLQQTPGQILTPTHTSRESRSTYTACWRMGLAFLSVFNRKCHFWPRVWANLVCGKLRSRFQCLQISPILSNKYKTSRGGWFSQTCQFVLSSTYHARQISVIVSSGQRSKYCIAYNPYSTPPPFLRSQNAKIGHS